jgi:hypothetical protein
MGKMRNAYKILFKDLNGKDLSESIGVNRRIILNLIEKWKSVSKCG